MNMRSPNVFEKILLVIGVMMVIVGYSFIQRMYMIDGYVLSWSLLQTMFLWLILAVMLIQLAVSENMKEELKLIIQEHIQEIRLLKKKRK